MNTILLNACGITNALFAVFHVWLGVRIQSFPALDPGYRALMQAFNVGGTLLIGFLAVAFLACRADLSSRLGRASIFLGAALYLTRAATEFVFFPVLHPVVVMVCIAAGLLHLAALRPRAVAPMAAS